MAVYRLESDSVWFPAPEEAEGEYDGLLAVGGDYSPERLLTAYASGIFPWPVEAGKPITWFSPDPRFVLKAADLHIPKSLVKTLRIGGLHLCHATDDEIEQTGDFLRQLNLDQLVLLHCTGEAAGAKLKEMLPCPVAWGAAGSALIEAPSC